MPLTIPTWTLDDALDLIRRVQPTSMTAGYYLALAGGVLNRGSSSNDLDLVAVPRTESSDPSWFIQDALPRMFGTPLDISPAPKVLVVAFVPLFDGRRLEVAVFL